MEHPPERGRVRDMTKKYRKQLILLGLAFTIASALITVAMTYYVYGNSELYERMLEYLFDIGMDTMGALVCAALYYGCMRQNADGTREFRNLVVLVSAGFLVNFGMYCTIGVPEMSRLTSLSDLPQKEQTRRLAIIFLVFFSD